MILRLLVSIYMLQVLWYWIQAVASNQANCWSTPLQRLPSLYQVFITNHLLFFPPSDPGIWVITNMSFFRAVIVWRNKVDLIILLITLGLWHRDTLIFLNLLYDLFDPLIDRPYSFRGWMPKDFKTEGIMNMQFHRRYR